MYDTSKPLTDREADRLKTELEARNTYAKLRELRNYSPSHLAGTLGLEAAEIARMAGRENIDYVPRA